MKFKVSNKTFYRRHNNELERFLNKENSIHIINEISKHKITEELSTKYFVNLEKPELLFTNISNKYDLVVLTDVLESSYNIFELFKQIKKILNPNGKLIISSINTKWNFILKFLEFLKLKEKSNQFSYVHNKKIQNVAMGVGFELINTTSRQFFPFKTLLLGNLINNFFEIIFFFLNLGIKTYIVFKNPSHETHTLTKTIIVPAKNEAGNLEELINRIPTDHPYEIILACGRSTDNTLEIAKRISSNQEFFKVKTIEQTLNGKANAVWEALDHSTGDCIAILDADISVDPETLPEFFSIIDNNYADFVNGTRLIYDMETGAMRSINKIGNRIFQFFIGRIINVNLTDSLCGTKVFKKELIPKIKWWQNKYNVIDPFGDFDLLFTAAYTGNKILEYPIYYRSRKYGKTQISRFRDGYKLIKYMTRTFAIFNTSKS